MFKQLAIFGALLLASFGAGWTVSGWHRDSLNLTITQAASAAGESARVSMQDMASASARELENKLEALRNAQPKEIRTELVKPVFTNRCVSDDFIRMYNTAAESAERTLSGKPVNALPQEVAAP